uniref:Syntaxin 8 n=1 Tax=Poecilia reticulata TaxID=8081 RepID=A0A3P9PSR7_POERE
MMSQDPWLQNYDATCRLAQEIAENIHERNRQQRTGGNPAKINMTLRASLQKLKQNIAQLKEGLLRSSSSRRIMQSEADRRQNLIDNLLTREKQLNATFKGDVTEPEPSRSTLMSGGAAAGTANPWLVEESEETKGLSFGEIKQQQQRIIEVQDAGLDALAAVISRQKIMGQEIGNELDEQNGKVNDPLLRFCVFFSFHIPKTYQSVKSDRQMLLINRSTCLIDPDGKEYAVTSPQTLKTFPHFVTLLVRRQGILSGFYQVYQQKAVHRCNVGEKRCVLYRLHANTVKLYVVTSQNAENLKELEIFLPAGEHVPGHIDTCALKLLLWKHLSLQ